MRWAWMRLAGWMAIGLCLCTAAPAARGQQTPMVMAAAQLSEPIAHSKQHKLIVFDFVGPDNRMTQLGKQLADDLSAALAKQSSLQVEDRSRAEKEFEQFLHAPQIVADPGNLLAFAQDLGAQAFVFGKISQGQDKRLSVELTAYRVNNGKGIGAVKVFFPLDEVMSKLLATDLSSDGEIDFSKHPDAGAAGYSMPRCIYCPRADYSRDAEAAKAHGTVVLIAIVGEDGRIHNVRVLQGLPDGLTAEAITAVQRWKLQPATGPDGKPAAVREIIEVAFKLF